MPRLRFLIVRILGNNLPGLHGHRATFKNAKFTLENESLPDNVEVEYCLNRIVSAEERRDLAALLDQFDAKYFEIPFVEEDFLALERPKCLNQKNTYLHNLYLVNVNGARNQCLEYGLESGKFDWILPLDANSFFTPEMWSHIVSEINPSDELLILPQLRINHNHELPDPSFSWKSRPTYEPQVGFHRNTNLRYNPLLPYGAAPKAELLRICGVPGTWKHWLDNESSYEIPDRDTVDVRFNTITGVIRLSSHNPEVQWSHPTGRIRKWFFRWAGNTSNQKILAGQPIRRENGLNQIIEDLYSAASEGG